MYKRVLVTLALDHGLSHALFQTARHLADPEAEILAIHVVETAYGVARATQSEAHGDVRFESARGLMAERLSAEDGVEGHIVEGNVHRSIVAFATEHDVDCIVIGSHKPDLRDYLLGSTATNVVRHAPCSVHVVR